MAAEENGLRHMPEGYYPNDGSICDRSPRSPEAGDFVIVRAEIEPELAAGGVALVYECGRRKHEVPGRFVREHRQAQASCMAVSEAPPLEYYLFELGRFGAGDEVEYWITAGAGERRISAGPYRFKVAGRFTAGGRALIYPHDGGAVVVFDRQGHYRPAAVFAFRDGRLHVSLAQDGADGLSGDPVDSWTCSDPSTGSRLVLAGEPFRFEIFDAADRRLCGSPTDADFFAWRGAPEGGADAFVMALDSPAEHYYGFGERFDAVDQNGRSPDVSVVNQYTRQGSRTYLPVPFFLTERGYGLFVESDRYVRYDLSPRLPGTLHLEARVNPRDPRLEIIFFFGRPKEIVRRFTLFTGQPALPPKWIFGPWMSANGWNTQRLVEENLGKTADLDIPATVLVIEAWSDEATYYIFNGAKYQAKPGGKAFRLSDFSFAEDGIWPDPKGLVDRVHAAGMRLVLWQIPTLKYFAVHENEQHRLDEEYAIAQGLCALNTDGTPYRFSTPSGWFDRGLLPDFTNPATREWWFAKRRYLIEDLGVDGFKTDGGEFITDDTIRFHDGSDGAVMRNRYPLTYIAAYHEFMGDKTFTFSRAGFTGGQKYPAYWAGDQVSSFEEFRAVIKAGLSLGLSGNAFWGFDLAGFAGGLPTADLYLRATAAAAFCPIMQYHSDTPRAGVERTPWNIAACTGDERVVPIYRFYAWLRMNLLPYIWREARFAAEQGEPLMRALCLDFPDDAIACKLEDEYMFGRDLLVAPVLEENVRERRLYLPADDWLDFWTLQPVAGGWHEKYPCDLETIPVFIRRGAVLPLNLGDSFGGGHQIVLWGKRKNIQRYRCKSCAKLFNDLTGTPLAHSKLPEKWSKMAVALQQSMTVRETAQYLGVCNDTAFRWRHRMLAGIREARLEVKPAGIVELDETCFRYSEKGARRLQRRPRKRGNDDHLRGRSKVYAVVARDRTSRTRSFLLRHMSGKELLSEAKNVIAEGSVLCSDYRRSYKTFALKSGHRHISLNLSKGKRVVHGIYHIQSVKSYHSRLKTWVRRFNGVATKYLLNYLVWHEHLDETRKFQRGMGEQKLFITALSAARLVAAA